MLRRSCLFVLCLYVSSVVVVVGRGLGVLIFGTGWAASWLCVCVGSVQVVFGARELWEKVKLFCVLIFFSFAVLKWGDLQLATNVLWWLWTHILLVSMPWL